MRKEIRFATSLTDMCIEMCEGNPGALNVLIGVIKERPDVALFILLNLDDMNIRGEQIWLGYKDCCDQNLEAFLSKVSCRDEAMIATINSRCRRHIAIAHGASDPGERTKLVKEEV